MRTRESVALEYDVNDETGLIETPGRFEAEPWWIVVVADWSMAGGGEDLSGDAGDWVELFELSPAERYYFGLPDDAFAVLYTISDQGFHGVQVLTQAETARVRADVEAEEA